MLGQISVLGKPHYFVDNATWSKRGEIEGYLLQYWKESPEKPNPPI